MVKNYQFEINPDLKVFHVFTGRVYLITLLEDWQPNNEIMNLRKDFKGVLKEPSHSALLW